MSKIKIIEPAREIYWATTYQGTWEVDGQEIEFRFHENSKSAELFIYDQNRGWVEVYDMEPGSREDTIYSMCMEMSASDWGDEDDTFEWEAEDYE